MAITWEIITDRKTGHAKYSGSLNQRDQMQASAGPLLKVKATDASDPDLASKIDEFDAMNAVDSVTGYQVPKVRRSIYFHNGQVIPFLMLASKDCKRNPNDATAFDIQLGYQHLESEEQNKQAPPSDISGYAARVVPEIGTATRVRYRDRNDKICFLPTGNWFPQPFIEEVGTLRLKITQYEPSISYETMLNRKKKCNTATWRGKGPYTWKIQDVQGSNAVIVLANPNPELPPITQLVAQLVYIVEYNPFPEGWRDERALIDTHYLETANDKTTKKPFTDRIGVTNPTGFVKTDGTIASPQVPNYDQWEIQKTINFNFLPESP